MKPGSDERFAVLSSMSRIASARSGNMACEYAGRMADTSPGIGMKADFTGFILGGAGRQENFRRRVPKRMPNVFEATFFPGSGSPGKTWSPRPDRLITHETRCGTG